MRLLEREFCLTAQPRAGTSKTAYKQANNRTPSCSGWRCVCSITNSNTTKQLFNWAYMHTSKATESCLCCLLQDLVKANRLPAPGLTHLLASSESIRNTHTFGFVHSTQNSSTPGLPFLSPISNRVVHFVHTKLLHSSMQATTEAYSKQAPSFPLHTTCP